MRSILVKRILNILLATKMLKQLDLEAYSFQKLMHIEKILIMHSEKKNFEKIKLSLEKSQQHYQKGI